MSCSSVCFSRAACSRSLSAGASARPERQPLACSWRHPHSAAARRAPKSSGKCRIALITGNGTAPPRAHSEPCLMVSQRSSSSDQVIGDTLAVHDQRDGLGAAHPADPAGRAFAARIRARRTRRRTGPVWPCRPYRRTPPRRRGRSGRRARRRLRSRTCVEQRAREIGAERPAHLHGAHRPAGRRAAADVVHDLAQRQAEARLEQAGMLDVAGELDGDGAARAPPCRGLIDAAPRSTMIGTDASEMTLLTTVGMPNRP